MANRNEIKNEIKDIVENLLIPEVEEYLEDLHKILEKNEQTDEDLEIIKDMESFLVELHNVLAVIEEDKLETAEFERIHEQILKHAKEHDEE